MHERLRLDQRLRRADRGLGWIGQTDFDAVLEIAELGAETEADRFAARPPSGPKHRLDAAFFGDLAGQPAARRCSQEFERSIEVCLADAVAPDQHSQVTDRQADAANGPVAVDGDGGERQDHEQTADPRALRPFNAGAGRCGPCATQPRLSY
jgi:hypothetical protein